MLLVHCNIVNNDYQQDSRVLYTFVPNKPFGSILNISPANHIFSNKFNDSGPTKAVNVLLYRKTKGSFVGPVKKLNCLNKTG